MELVHLDPFRKNKNKGWRSGSSGRALPGKCEALSSNSNTATKPKMVNA
jgi:hypothetical protein